MGERVRSGRAREVVEAQAQHDRAAHAPRGAQPPRDAVDDPDEDGIQLRRATAAAGPSACCVPIERRRTPDAHRPRIAVVGQGVELAPGGAADDLDERRLREPGDLTDGGDPTVVELCAT